MAYETTSNELLSIDGVPLSTPAWEVLDFSDLLNGAPTRGADIAVSGKRGTVARRRTLDASEASVSLVVYGDRDPEGNAHEDVRAGLLSNIDALKKALRPNATTLTGTRTLSVTIGTETRTAAVHTSPDIAIAPLGPTAVRAVITLVLPYGVLRGASTVANLSGTGSKTLTVTGTGEVYDILLTVSGKANSLSISNLSYDGSGGVSLNYGYAFDGTLSFNADTYVALYGGAPVTGKVVTAGTPIWLPLLPGSNSLNISAPGLVGDLTTTVTYRPVYL
jgi:hypothetical protein